MFVSALRLVNFRSYADAQVAFGPGLNVVVGANATGKTNLLEGAWFALRGGSPRTRREEKLITWGRRFTRVELALGGHAAGPQAVEIGFAPGQGKRIRWNGADVVSLEDLRARSHVVIFVPESLLLVKGSPARRRAHLDSFAAAIDVSYAAAARDFQAVLRQRNAQLLAVKHGAPERALQPWDTQFARVAVEFGRRRRDLVSELSARFGGVAARLAPEGQRFILRLNSKLMSLGYDEGALSDELRARRPGEVSRGLSLVGPHRDDLVFLESGSSAVMTPAAGADISPEGSALPPTPAGGRDLKLFGSQGEQRVAVLALLLAEQQVAQERTGEQGMLFLDDVMSELDDERRRLLVRHLTAAGQAIITTTNRQYFTDDELAEAEVIELPLGKAAADEFHPGPSSADESGAPGGGSR